MLDYPFHKPDIAPFPETCSVTLTAAGLKLGSKTLLVRFDAGSRNLAIAADFPRCSALLSVAARRAMPPSLVGHLEAAASFWQRGDPALANLRLVFAGLPLLDADDVARARVAEHLLDEGCDPTELLKELGLDPAEKKLAKYDRNELRVPAGQGDESGEWTNGVWSRVAPWLDEPVPVYDQDTGIEVGQQPRGQAIAFNPVTVGAAGAAIVFGAEAAIEALGLGLTPYARQYLRGEGGPWGMLRRGVNFMRLLRILKDQRNSSNFGEMGWVKKSISHLQRAGEKGERLSISLPSVRTAPPFGFRQSTRWRMV